MNDLILCGISILFFIFFITVVYPPYMGWINKKKAWEERRHNRWIKMHSLKMKSDREIFNNLFDN